ncbi:MerR family transcriptional regulator [Pseudonocardia sp. CA-107938]|uniref:MerR family transcriptional regulator n=1 Tax=Pseudonocardia sp. CA-107938 TaxID=3240021 RepID=UPI003D9474C2
MSIGAFARLCRLTVKAVRHYAAEGLLEPAHVDPSSGYRYYTAEQVPAATTIALLRRLEVPIPVVREVLAAPDEAAVAAVLAGQRAQWAAELARREQVLRALDGLLANPDRVRYDVTIAAHPQQRLTGVRGTVRAADLDDDIAALCRRALVAGIGREPLMAVYPLDLAEEMDVLVGVTSALAGLPDAQVLPAGTWASTLHVGPYETLSAAYTALLEHVREQGHEAVGPVTETYLTDPSTSGPDELVTRIAVLMIGSRTP